MPPIFDPYMTMLWPNGWMDQDVTWYTEVVGLGPDDNCVRWGLMQLPTERGTTAPHFRNLQAQAGACVRIIRGPCL